MDENYVWYCSNCIFRNKVNGKCHRFPRAYIGYGQMDHPFVSERDWCGEYKQGDMHCITEDGVYRITDSSRFM